MINVCLWLLGGLLAGGIASRLPRTLTPINMIANSIAGAFGALLGGVVFLIFDTAPLGSVNLWALLIALISAVIAISLVRATFRYIP